MAHINRTPGDGRTSHGGAGISVGNNYDSSTRAPFTANPVIGITVCDAAGCEHHLAGREAFALAALINRGAEGVTPLDYPAPRWSDYVFKLRRRGFAVETLNEKHGGAFSGTHARYLLNAPLTVLKIERQGDRHAA